MTKKRLFVAIACICVMSLSLFSLVACKKPADVEGNGQETEIEVPNSGFEIVEDKAPVPTATLKYSLSNDGDYAILMNIGENTSLSDIVIADTYAGKPVAEIAEDAFADRKSLASVKILGNNLQTIGAGAFRNCEALKTINIPGSVININDAAFRSCFSLESISLPENLSFLGNSVFHRCEKLQEIKLPQAITTVSEQLFWGCTALKSVTFAADTTIIDKEAFRKCEALETITLPDKLEQINEKAFMNCNKLKAITIPNNVEELGLESFRECEKLETLTFVKEDSKLTTIGIKAFMGCKGLKTVNNMPNTLTTIDDYAFANTEKLANITLNQGLSRIGKYAFHNSGLTEITITSGVEIIDDFAFDSCKNLKDVHFPLTIKYIGEGAFRSSGVLPEAAEGQPEILKGRQINFTYVGTKAAFEQLLADGKIITSYHWGDVESVIKVKCTGSGGAGEVIMKFGQNN